MPKEDKEIKILIVEDDKGVAGFMREAILSLGIVDRVDIALTYDAAVRRIRAQHYGIVLLDLMIDERDCGARLAGEIRNADNDTVIVVVTGFPELALDKELVSVPIDDFLWKPVRMEKLRDVILHSYTRYHRRIRLSRCLLEKSEKYNAALQKMRDIEQNIWRLLKKGGMR